MHGRWGWSLLAILLAAGLLLGAWHWRSRTPSRPEAQEPVHVAGSAACATCHPSQYEQWRESNHRHAMEPPTRQSVRGDFGDVEFQYFGRTTRFFKDGEAFLVTTENQRGQPETFRIAYTLGYRPLQQYLVDVGAGRLQALPFAWDTRSREDGGQRWFHLYPDENVTPENPLFWMRPLQNWNHMCGECHTTGFAKGFDSASNAFRSEWSETGNGCESCHGAGLLHIEERQAGRAGTPADAAIRSLKSFQEQIDQCGFCHARRVRLRDPKPRGRMHETMLETWRPQLPQEGLYFVDGQIQDEVFEIGSFLQSKMAAEGVRCTDCHDPHTARLRADGNAVCTQCHVPERFDLRQHYFHEPSSPGAQCVACHMPVRTYMVVDDRHDHRLGVPTPELSDALGSPNACVTCHNGQTNAWAARVIERHVKATGTVRDASNSLGIVARKLAREQTDAADLLRRFIEDPSTASIAKATALAASTTVSPALLQIAQEQLGSADALVRLGAVQAAGRAPLSQRLAMLPGLLLDPSGAVRREVAGLLAGADEAALPIEQRTDLRAAVAEHRQSLSGDADRAEALVAMAGLQAAAGDAAGARASYEQALRQDELSLVTLLNYADFNRAHGDDDSAERLLTRAAVLYPDAAAVRFALGLLRVRQNRHAEAVGELARAAQLSPHDSSYAYVHAVALYSTGQTARALSVLEDARRRFPASEQIRSALDAYCADLRQEGAVGRDGAGRGPDADRCAATALRR